MYVNRISRHGLFCDARNSRQYSLSRLPQTTRVGREDDKFRIPVCRNVSGVGMDHHFYKLKISSNECELKTSRGSLTKPFRTILVLFMKIEGIEILRFLVSVFCKQQLMDG